MNYSNTKIKLTNHFLQKSKSNAYCFFIFWLICFPKSCKVRKKFHFLRIHKNHFMRFWEKKVENPARGASLQKSKSKSKNVRIHSIVGCRLLRWLGDLGDSTIFFHHEKVHTFFVVVIWRYAFDYFSIDLTLILTPREHVPTVNVGIPHCGGVDKHQRWCRKTPSVW